MNQTQLDLKHEVDRIDNVITQLEFMRDGINKILNKKY